ncbi:HD-GYP domain-containing protein [Helicovermis profundi]|uniref:Stage 0 sporulation protein A homolog n=1 Tax=Helicovermis profundi TaxID=3065157 RepID=A0AAU9EMQ8_9FIRM|nr:two-component system response regulator [Clostridia bacterium S502]
MEKTKLLIIDDTKINIDILLELLGDDYNISVALDGDSGLSIAKKVNPEILLLDIMMPNKNGFEVLKELKLDSKLKDIAVIFMTAINDVETEIKGIDLGAIDYIRKPFNGKLVKSRIKNHLELKKLRDNLQDEVNSKIDEIIGIQNTLVETMCDLVEYRDSETGLHIKRTQIYAKLLALDLKKNGYYIETLTDDYIRELNKSTPLHDIGKIGISDTILLKPARLTDDEFKIMKTHTIIGYEIMESTKNKFTCKSYLDLAKDIAISHHEKWNGKGYPYGLKKSNIPLAGRIVAVVDVYDALVSKRIYKEPMTHVKAVSIIETESGESFDPIIVKSFLNIANDFEKVNIKYKD